MQYEVRGRIQKEVDTLYATEACRTSFPTHQCRPVQVNVILEHKFLTMLLLHRTWPLSRSSKFRGVLSLIIQSYALPVLLAVVF